ncbi:selenide, water dikinase SelD [bacterium]|nr:selenide, water dikinase SelD [bacterium]
MLDRLLPQLPKTDHPNLIVGPSSLDDAGVFRLSDTLALVQTVDFFTPIVDDPADYGRIAAANSLSDVYAMGGTPITALNIVAFPDGTIPEEALAELLVGAAEICELAGVAVAGGHTVSDQELKFGLSVTGTVHPDKLLTNSGLRPGQLLFLTKPLGTGLISNAMMNDAAPAGSVEAMIEVMVRLNRAASEAALAAQATGATDITGFGLLGHAREMAKASGVQLLIEASKLPVLDAARTIAESGSYYSGGERRNLSFVERDVTFDDSIDEATKRIVSDPQTSGGLLIGISPEHESTFREKMDEAGEEVWMVGQVEPLTGTSIHLKR